MPLCLQYRFSSLCSDCDAFRSKEKEEWFSSQLLVSDFACYYHIWTTTVMGKDPTGMKGFDHQGIIDL